MEHIHSRGACVRDEGCDTHATARIGLKAPTPVAGCLREFERDRTRCNVFLESDKMQQNVNVDTLMSGLIRLSDRPAMLKPLLLHLRDCSMVASATILLPLLNIDDNSMSFQTTFPAFERYSAFLEPSDHLPEHRETRDGGADGQ